MKKIAVFFAFILAGTGLSKAQYWTNGGEIIFSWAEYRDSTGTKISGPPRFSLFFHLNYKYNIDIGKHLGLAFGVSMRNIGFITRNETFESPGSESPGAIKYDKIKRRSYTLGVPAMLKIGNMPKDRFLALGAEYELFFHFKEKRFLNGNKFKRKEFMSDETNRFIPSVFAGWQFSKYGMIKVQYYLDDFLNRDFLYKGRKLYGDYTSRMIFVSWMGNIRYKGIREVVKDKNNQKASARMLKNIRVNY